MYTNIKHDVSETASVSFNKIEEKGANSVGSLAKSDLK
jgi:hypothetical protein